MDLTPKRILLQWGRSPTCPLRYSTTFAVTTTINGEPMEFLCEPYETMLDALRGQLGLTGSKEGCASGDCGACCGCCSGSFAYFASRTRMSATSLPPSSLCSFICFCQATTTGSVARRQGATSSAASTAMASPRWGGPGRGSVKAGRSAPVRWRSRKAGRRFGSPDGHCHGKLFIIVITRL